MSEPEDDGASGAAEWLEARLERELSDEAMWQVVSGPRSEARSAALRARALELYSQTAPFLDSRAHELTAHDTRVLGVLRGVGDAHAIESWDGWTNDDRRELMLPTRSSVEQSAASLGLHSVDATAGPSDAGHGDGSTPTDDVLDLFARDVNNTLNYFTNIQASREKLLDDDFLGRMRELSIRQLALARKWGGWARNVDDEAVLMEYAGIAIVISQMFVVAAFDPNGAEDLFPDRTWLVTRLENSRALPWLASRGATIPEWLAES